MANTKRRRSLRPPGEELGPGQIRPASLGLSTAELEARLGLAAGSWKRRHLYALRTTTTAFKDIGLKIGDFLIVEPGPRESPGHLVLRRTPQGLRLRLLPRHEGAEQLTLNLGDNSRGLTSPTLTPHPKFFCRGNSAAHATDSAEPRSSEDRDSARFICKPGIGSETATIAAREPAWLGEHTVGTVIAAIRASASGALRPIALPALRVSGRRTVSTRPNTSSRPGNSRRRVSSPRRSLDPRSNPQVAQLKQRFETLEHMHSNWCGILAKCPQLKDLDPQRWRYWNKLEANLATLLECLRFARGTRLALALLAEAEPLVRAMKREMSFSPFCFPL